LPATKRAQTQPPTTQIFHPINFQEPAYFKLDNHHLSPKTSTPLRLISFFFPFFWHEREASGLAALLGGEKKERARGGISRKDGRIRIIGCDAKRSGAM